MLLVSMIVIISIFLLLGKTMFISNTENVENYANTADFAASCAVNAIELESCAKNIQKKPKKTDNLIDIAFS